MNMRSAFYLHLHFACGYAYDYVVVLYAGHVVYGDCVVNNSGPEKWIGGGLRRLAPRRRPPSTWRRPGRSQRACTATTQYWALWC